MMPPNTHRCLYLPLTASVFAACASQASTWPTIRSEGVVESSGLVASRVRDDVLWTHNDSGSEPRIFAINTKGEAVQSVKVVGARSIDWEDIAVDDQGHLYIGDHGNNWNRRRDLTVYVVDEPAAGDTEVQVSAAVRFRFPDQTAFPPAKRNFDAESLFWHSETLWLFTKHRGDLRSNLYRFPSLDPTEEQVLVKVGSLPVDGDPGNFGGMTTAADVHPDGTVALLTYHALFLIPWGGDSPDLTGVHHRIDLDQTQLVQCEGIAWVGDELFITNESSNLFRIEKPHSITRFPEQPAK